MVKQQRIGSIGWFVNQNDDYGVSRAFCDVNPAKVARYTDSNPALKGYTDYREMAESNELDLVVISTPNWLHREMAECFLSNGINVFLEKPMGINRTEIDSVLGAWENSNSECAIDFEVRMTVLGRRVKELIDSGTVGTVSGVEFFHHRGAWLAQGNGTWRTDPARSGGMYFMEVCHGVDVLRYWLGEVSQVQSFSFANVLPQYPSTMPDNICTHFWFESGARAMIHTSHTSSVADATVERYDELGHDMTFIITGSDGAIRIDCIRQKMLICRYNDFHPDAEVGRRVDLERIEDYSDMSPTQFHHDIGGNRRAFIRSCAEGVKHHQDLDDAWRTHVVGIEAERSALTDSPRIAINFDR